MKCPYCGYAESKVVDSRPADEGESIRRRRECLSCSKRFTTYENVESLPLVVIKKDSRRETFDRNKILNGMLKACEKRPISCSSAAVRPTCRRASSHPSAAITRPASATTQAVWRHFRLCIAGNAPAASR